MTTYAVTGATGHLGRLVVEHLLGRGIAAADVVALVRSPEKAQDLAGRGVQVREADYEHPATLDAALAGVDRLLLVSSPEVGKRLPQHTHVIEAAARAGVSRIAYTSLLGADSSPLGLAPEHVGTEQLIATTGLPASILRNGWYVENFPVGQYAQTGAVLHAAAEGRIAAATRSDLAEAAAVALIGDDEADVVHELAGPAFTYADLASTVAAVTGKDVVARNLPVEELTAVLTGAGLDAGTAGFLAQVDVDIAAGALDGEPTDLERLLGRPATSLVDAVRQQLGA